MDALVENYSPLQCSEWTGPSNNSLEPTLPARVLTFVQSWAWAGQAAQLEAVVMGISVVTVPARLFALAMAGTASLPFAPDGGLKRKLGPKVLFRLRPRRHNPRPKLPDCCRIPRCRKIRSV